MAKLTEKLVNSILNIIEKRIEKVVIIKREYNENVMVKGFHSVRFHANFSQPMILGKDSAENKRKINNISKKLVTECRKQVEKDIQDYMEEVKKLKKKKKKNK
jgi:hypothetical protein